MNDEFILNNDNDTNTTNWNVSYSNEDGMVSEEPAGVPLYYLVIMIVAGTLGNSLVCLAIYLDRKLQNLTNYFLLSLAITDLLVSLVILPARLYLTYGEFLDLEPSMFPLCFLYLIGDDFITAASAIHICFISCERYFAIKNPFDRKNLTKGRVIKKIGMVWFLAFLTVIPYMRSAIITEHPNERTSCDWLLAKFEDFNIVIGTEIFVIAVMVVVVVVSFILTSILLQDLVKKQETAAKRCSGMVRNVGGKISDDKPNNNKARQVLQSEQKALRVVWLVSFAFMICMVPYTCTSLSYLLFPNVIIPPVLLDITAYLGYCNSIINPIIYTIFNKRFRGNFINIALCKYKKNESANGGKNA